MNHRTNEAGRSLHCKSLGTASPPARRTESSTIGTSANFTSHLLRLAVRGRSALDYLTLQIYNYEAQGTGSALLFFSEGTQDIRVLFKCTA